MRAGQTIDIKLQEKRAFDPVRDKLAVLISTDQLTTPSSRACEESFEEQIGKIGFTDIDEQGVCGTLSDETGGTSASVGPLNLDQRKPTGVNPDRETSLPVRSPKRKYIPIPTALKEKAKGRTNPGCCASFDRGILKIRS